MDEITKKLDKVLITNMTDYPVAVYDDLNNTSKEYIRSQIEKGLQPEMKAYTKWIPPGESIDFKHPIIVMQTAYAFVETQFGHLDIIDRTKLTK